MNEIKLIKEGSYLDESEVIETDNTNTNTRNEPNNTKNDGITLPLLKNNSPVYKTFTNNDNQINI